MIKDWFNINRSGPILESKGVHVIFQNKGKKGKIIV